MVIQLCRMLKLRAIAIVRQGGDYDKIVTELKTFGASEARGRPADYPPRHPPAA